MGPLELFGLNMHRPRRNFNVLVSKGDCFICGLGLTSGPFPVWSAKIPGFQVRMLSDGVIYTGANGSS